MNADEDEVLKLDVIGTIADFPAWVRVFLHRQVLAVEHEPLNTLGHILREFGERDGLRGAAEVLGGDLATPLPISGPLKGEITPVSIGKFTRKGNSNLEADRHAGSASLEDDLVTVAKLLGAEVQSIFEEYAVLLRMFRYEVERSFQ